MHYGKEYFDWQKNIGRIGAEVDYFKVEPFVEAAGRIVEFGCGGGYFLERIPAGKEKIGIEINEVAREECARRGISVFESLLDAPRDWADLVFAHHSLEHVENPLEALKQMLACLKPGGRLLVVVPFQDAGEEWRPDDVNQHLYSWNRLTLGNLVARAGFVEVAPRLLQHQWPGNFEELFRRYDAKKFFRLAVRTAERNRNYQIIVSASRPR